MYKEKRSLPSIPFPQFYTQTVPSLRQDFWYSLMQVRAFQSLKTLRHPQDYKNAVFSPSQPWTLHNLGEKERLPKAFGKDL